MPRVFLRGAALFGLVGVIVVAGLALSTPAEEIQPVNDRIIKAGEPNGGPFRPCPVPPCAAPCIFGAEPTVRCKSAEGPVVRTTFACCCCGGGGNLYKPL